MSLALGHFAFGAAMTTLCLLLLPPIRYPRTVVLAGGGWSMLPDLYWVSPVAQETIRQFHQTSTLTDLFWFHRTLDSLDPADTPEVAAACFALLVVATMLAERLDYHLPAVVEHVYETHAKSDPK